MDAFGSRFDIAIAGGGPAGAVAAILLTRAGFRVALASLPPQGPRIEGLAPRVAALLEAQGIALEGVGPATARLVEWGGPARAQNREHLVARDLFDAGLLAQAADAGVTMILGPIAAIRPQQGEIVMRSGQVLSAGLVVEARGRRAGRAEGSTLGPATISIAGHSDPLMPQADAALAALPRGWVWQARGLDGQSWLQVVGDADLLAGAGDKAARLARAWAGLLGPAAPPVPLQPRVTAIAPRLTAPRFDPLCPRLGDAAVALDPLSGHGMFWAVSSALMIAPVARALLDGEGDLAREFYQARVIETFWRQARVGRDFYRAAGASGPFWAARAAWPDDQPAHPRIERPHLSQRVILREGRLSRAEVLITAAEPGGAAFVYGQELAPLLRALPPGPLPGREVFHRQLVPHLPPAQAAALHGWLIHRGLGSGLSSPSNDKDREIGTCSEDEAA